MGLTLTQSINQALVGAGLPPDDTISTTVLPSLAYALDAGVSVPDASNGDVTLYQMTMTINAPNQAQAIAIMTQLRACLNTFSDSNVKGIAMQPANAPSSISFGYQGLQTYSLLAIVKCIRRHDARGNVGFHGTTNVTFWAHP